MHSNPSIFFTLSYNIKKVCCKLCEYCQIKNDESKNSVSQEIYASNGLISALLRVLCDLSLLTFFQNLVSCQKVTPSFSCGKRQRSL